MFQKEYQYNQQSLEEALDIMEKTVFKKKKIAGFCAFAAFGIASIILGIASEDVYISLFAGGVFFIIFPLLTYGSFRKEFISANSPETVKNYWSLNRKITIYDNHINIYAEYQSEPLTDEDRADEDYVKYVEECNEEMSNMNFKFSKCRCYESEKTFIIYRSRDENEIISKSQLDYSDIEYMHNTFKEKFGEKYKELKIREEN